MLRTHLPLMHQTPLTLIEVHKEVEPPRDVGAIVFHKLPKRTLACGTCKGCFVFLGCDMLCLSPSARCISGLRRPGRELVGSWLSGCHDMWLVSFGSERKS